jgi:hypothetical protein
MKERESDPSGVLFPEEILPKDKKLKGAKKVTI